MGAILKQMAISFKETRCALMIFLMIFHDFLMIFNNFLWFFMGAILKKMTISFKENALRVNGFLDGGDLEENGCFP